MTKEELNAALVLTRKIDRLKNRLSDLRETGGVGSPGTNTPVMGGPDAIGVGQIATEMAQEIAELERKLEVEREIIRRGLAKVPLDDVGRKLMILRYVDCRSFQLVAMAIGYASRQMYRIHDTALKMAVDGSP